MTDKVFCIGNGESRNAFDLNKLKPHGKIYGCNALYRDFTPDVLCAVDMGIMHEIYNSGYAENNPVVFRDWNLMPGNMYENLLFAGRNYSDQEYDMIKKEEVIKANERTDKTPNFVLHGSNLAGVVEILKKNKTRDKKQVNHTNINVSWCTETDKVRNISDHMKPKDRGWACGATAGYFALLDEKPNEGYLIGHDLESVDGKLNNMYKDTKHYGLKEAHKTPSINWINQWLELYKENPNVQFYKVNPTADSCKDAISTPVKEWQGIGNLKYIDYMALDKMLEK